MPIVVAVSISLCWTGAASAYLVRPGDSLSALALRFGTTVASLERVNGLSPDGTLLAGSELRLPVVQTLRRYTVMPGDTLSGVAQAFHTSVRAIARASRLANVQVIPVGAILEVPLAHVPTPRGLSYRVRPGDSLSAIAVRFHVSLTALAAVNGLDLRALLLAGRTLLLPPGADPAAIQVAAGDPLPTGSFGSDISYPNCDLQGTVPPGFVVVGVNAGRPFTANPCFAREYRWALGSGKPPGIYLNSSYSPTMLGSITPDCRSRSAATPLDAPAQEAYALGCSEAAAALATPLPLVANTLVWIDVEISNSWSADHTLNTATLQGMLGYLRSVRPAPLIGLYSSSVWWNVITGGWRVPPLPEWSPDAPVSASACAPSFASGPVWISQSVETSLDIDRAC